MVLQDIDDWFENNFNVYDGPPRAFFEYDNLPEGITRIVYHVYGVGCWINPKDDAENRCVDTLIEKFKVILKPFYGKTLWWRARPRMNIEDELNHLDGWTPTGRQYCRIVMRFGIAGFNGEDAKLEGWPVEIID